MPRPSIDYKDKSISVDWRIDRCSHNIKSYEHKLSELKETLKELALEKFQEGTGIEIGQFYDFKHEGKVASGQVLGIQIKKGEYSLKVKFAYKKTITYLAPEQIIGYEAIPQERLKVLFQVLDRATK